MQCVLGVGVDFMTLYYKINGVGIAVAFGFQIMILIIPTPSRKQLRIFRVAARDWLFFFFPKFRPD